MDVLEKLTILTDAAKYDAACTSSGGNRAARAGMIGNTSTAAAGCCHTFSADGRCVTLLKVLLTNRCVYDCKYCVNRRSNDTPRTAFTPQELADLTINFYRRNYIEGLFLSSGVFRSPDYTMELMIQTLRLLREGWRFNGYIHAKAIPGASPELVEQLGLLADRLSVNIELPSEAGLNSLAPDKTKRAILNPMRQIQSRNQQSREELVKYRHAPRFAPAGQSTQLIVGATPDSDFHIMRLTQGLYDRYQLKRVFYSAYVPVVEHAPYPLRTQNHPSSGNTGSIRPIGSCGSTTSGLRNSWMNSTGILIPAWTQNAAGLWLIRNSIRWRSILPITKPFCASPAWGPSPLNAFSARGWWAGSGSNTFGSWASL